MRKPQVGKPRSVGAIVTLSRKLPRFGLPASAPPSNGPLAHPQVNRPQRPVAAAPEPVLSATACTRCTHEADAHPLRYVCDRYPHPDPLRICGCAVDAIEDVCSHCGHKGRAHKPRHRCRAAACGCWGYEQA